MRGKLDLWTGKWEWEADQWRTDKGNISPKKVEPLVKWLEDQSLSLEELQQITEAANEVAFELREVKYMPDQANLESATENLAQVLGW